MYHYLLQVFLRDLQYRGYLSIEAIVSVLIVLTISKAYIIRIVTCSQAVIPRDTTKSLHNIYTRTILTYHMHRVTLSILSSLFYSPAQTSLSSSWKSSNIVSSESLRVCVCAWKPLFERIKRKIKRKNFKNKVWHRVNQEKLNKLTTGWFAEQTGGEFFSLLSNTWTFFSLDRVPSLEKAFTVMHESRENVLVCEKMTMSHCWRSFKRQGWTHLPLCGL